MCAFRYIKAFMLIALLPFLDACSSHVYFFDQEQNQSSIPIRVYLDSFGNLYPESGYPIGYMATNPSIYELTSDYGNGLCQQVVSGSEAEILCNSITPSDRFCGGGPYCFPSNEWRNAQAILWGELAKKTAKKYSSQNNENIVFLIHGFNNNVEESRPMFELVRENIIATDILNRPLFVEIYWDGSKGGPLTGAWSSSQFSGPLVGFNLRQLFENLRIAINENEDELPKVKIFTHSSGAFIVGALLGDPTDALPDLQEPKSADYEFFKENVAGGNERYPIPKDYPSIDVGLIAAATPSTTFTRGPKGEGIIADNTKLYFSINPDDFALGKGFRLYNYFGATGAGASRELFCMELKKIDKPGVSTYAYDFESGFNFSAKSHQVSYYFKHPSTQRFLQDWLADEGTNYNFDCSEY